MDRDVAAAGQFEPPAGVLDDLLGGDIAAGGRDADDVDVVLAAQVGEGERIVDSGVTVEEQRDSGGHGPIVPDVSSHRRRILVPISSPKDMLVIHGLCVRAKALRKLQPNSRTCRKT